MAMNLEPIMAPRKCRLTLLPWSSLEEVAYAMDFKHGHTDYIPGDWRDRKSYEEHIEAALRHLSKELSGVEYDEETGSRHVAHAAARLLMALDPSYEVRRVTASDPPAV